MSSPLIDIPEAVKELLNGQSFSQAFTATREYMPKWTLHELNTLRVTVIAPKVERNQFTRNSVEKLFPIQIGIMKRLSIPTPALIDPMVQLADEIADFFGPSTVLGSTGAQWFQTEHESIYLFDHLKDFSTFTSLIVVHFRL